jgi:N-acetylglucosamine-6-phosphate deacetylase
MNRRFLTGATLVLEDRMVTGHVMVIEDGAIVDVHSGTTAGGADDAHVALAGRIVVPGFVDAHVHGAEGVDVLDGPGAVRNVASRLPRYGVTAFSPTSVACSAATLAAFLEEVDQERVAVRTGSARVLPAHLESNFINPVYGGAQPRECICAAEGSTVTASEILAVIARTLGRDLRRSTRGD